MEWIRRNGPGILVCLCIAVPAWFLGRTFEVVGGPVFAILLGMVMALFWKEQGQARAGITFTSKKILQLAVVLLGFGMNLSSVAKVGPSPYPSSCPPSLPRWWRPLFYISCCIWTPRYPP